jgi:tripartite-type tricarboxylate transporter receptor subunit TctC
MRGSLALALAIAAACTAASYAAEAYPSRPIRFIMPYPVGGTIDTSGRAVALELGERLGQQLVVDNRTGAGGTLGAEMGAHSPPDGYTVVMGGTGTLAISPGLDRRRGYDPLRDFAPITLLATTPYVLVAHPSVPAANVRELIALAKTKPGGLIYASGGSGSAPHLIGEVFKKSAGIDLLHVPYKGSTPAKIDLMAGRAQLFFTGIPPVASEIRSGRLRALGVTSGHRTPALSDVPTIAESGVPGFDVSPWFGMLAPAHTPAAIVTRLHDEIVGILQRPAIRERFMRDGVDPVGSTPAEFAAFIRSERDKWAKAIRDSGAKAE